MQSTRPQASIVLDIDGTLVTEVTSQSSWIEQADKEKRLFLFRYRDNDGKESSLRLIILPWVYEALRHILIMLKFRLAFFSGAWEKRNEKLVKFMLLNALGETDYLQHKDQVFIYSAQHISPGDTKKDFIQKIVFGFDSFLSAYKKKKLTAVYPDLDVNSTILVEDNLAYANYGEERNCLYVPGVRSWDFQDEYLYKLAATSTLTASRLKNINQIFYILGLLITAQEKAQEQKISLTEALFNLQYNKGLLFYRFRIGIHSEIQYYERGGFISLFMRRLAQQSAPHSDYQRLGRI